MIPHWLAPGFLWGAMWPNIFAPSAITLAAVIISHVRRQLTARSQHAERMTQAERHHLEVQAQAAEHHNALVIQANRHHEQALDRMDTHAAAAKTRSKP